MEIDLVIADRLAAGGTSGRTIFVMTSVTLVVPAPPLPGSHVTCWAEGIFQRDCTNHGSACLVAQHMRQDKATGSPACCARQDRDIPRVSAVLS